jgi:hypothetical protein
LIETFGMKSILRKIVPTHLHLNAQLQRRILRESNGRVLGGLFRDMRYVPLSYGNACVPKILGTYEKEISSALEALLELEFDVIVVVGAAEGFYPVAFALKTKAQIISFEANPSAPMALDTLAKLNGMQERIKPQGLCDTGGLRASLKGKSRALVFMDIEGGEALLLDSSIIPELKQSYIVVETHDFAVVGTSALIRERFGQTHQIVEITPKERTAEDFPKLRDTRLPILFRGAAVQLMSEWRGGTKQSWLIMEPRSAKTPSKPSVALERAVE